MSAEKSNAVAVIQPPRLPYHPAIEERFGIDRSGWKALVESVFPNAKTSDAVVLALGYCKARKLDPFKRPVHIVPIWDPKKPKANGNGMGDFVETVWPGIAEHRTTAMRTGTHAGLDEPVFGPTIKKQFTGKVGSGDYAKTITVDMEFPEWCRITVYRMVQGTRVPFPGPKVYFMEFYSAQGKSGVPNDRWQRAPSGMLEKCAEAGALRRAFPEEIGDEWTAEEASGAAAAPMRDITPEAPAVPEPTRAEFVAPVEATGEETPIYPIVDAAGVVVAEAYANEWLAKCMELQAPADANKATALQVAADDDTPAEDRTAILSMYAPPAQPAADADDFPGDRPSKGAKR